MVANQFYVSPSQFKIRDICQLTPYEESDSVTTDRLWDLLPMRKIVLEIVLVVMCNHFIISIIRAEGSGERSMGKANPDVRYLCSPIWLNQSGSKFQEL